MGPKYKYIYGLEGHVGLGSCPENVIDFTRVWLYLLNDDDWHWFFGYQFINLHAYYQKQRTENLTEYPMG